MSSDDPDRRYPVAITGMHRSGTSMITRALHESGLQLVGGAADALVEAADDNPEGFWENKAIVDCNDELLEATGGAWDSPPDLPPLAADDERVAGVVEAAQAALDGLRENPPWGFKDPRLCLTARFWLDLEPDLRFVICVRHPLEVALSLKQRNQNSYSLGLALWERYYATLLDDVPEDRRIVTHYNSFFVDPEAELRRLCDFTGLTPVPPSVRPDLRHFEIGVSLDDANTSTSLRQLYGSLCEEAGVPTPPEPAAGEDEGRVRRLILDGFVAARHADQRQEAIENLEARLAEANATGHELRLEVGRLKSEAADARQQIIDARKEIERLETIEQRVAALTRTTDQLFDVTNLVVATTTATNDRLDSMEAINQETIAGVRETLAEVKGMKKKKKPGFRARVRRASRRGQARAAPIARQAAQRLPPSARYRVKRVKRAFDDGVAADRTAEALTRAVKRLPPRAQKVVRRGQAAGRRMPAPVKRLARRSVPGRATGPAPAPRPRAGVDQRPSRIRREAAPVRWGRPLREWREGYERLVADHVRDGARWAVVTPGSSDVVRGVTDEPATPFPVPSGTPPLVDQLSHVAVLEALRYEGHRYLVVPEGSRRWFQQQPELRDLLTRNYRTVADIDQAGVVFDLGAEADADAHSVLAAVNSVVGDVDVAPSVLDWTSLDLAAELPGYTCFSPPADERLPYLDESIEIVVVEKDRDLADAERVASLAVICLEDDGTAVISLRDADAVSSKRTPSVVVLVADSDDDRWLAAVGARANKEGAELRKLEPGDELKVSVGSVVVAIEPGVLPLPGAIAAAATAVTASPWAAIAGKVIDREGFLDSAGGFVFADGTVCGIGAGSDDVRGPWHEFVRPVCWAPGVVAASADLWNANAPTALGAPGILEWCGRIWTSDQAVRYQPRFTAVRVAPSSYPLVVDGSWGTGRRPARPAVLNEGVWRYLIAHDELGAGVR